MKQETDKTIIAYKGFDENLCCRNFQYEVGKTYEMDGEIKCCERGFHACENPLEVLAYYSPSTSRYCRVEQSGKVSGEKGESKNASGKIHIEAEIGLKGLIEAGVKFILDKVNWEKDKMSNSEDQSAATNTGYRSAATNTGNYSVAVVEGKESIAIVTGRQCKAKGALGCWLVLTERDANYHILGVKAVKVGESVNPDTFYQLINGEIKEVEN